MSKMLRGKKKLRRFNHKLDLLAWTMGMYLSMLSEPRHSKDDLNCVAQEMERRIRFLDKYNYQ